MEHQETYKGRTVRIVTSQASDGTWRFSSELADSPGQSFKGGQARSEREARDLGLSAAMAAVDRSRAGVGKP
ncbi:MAG TPA: hypothetical protein VGC15_14945 [Acetobacteraceae bacterium]